MEKNKYIDNRLAEELDLIVLTNNTHKAEGLPSGSLGALTYSYTGRGRPMYAEFLTDDGTRFELALRLHDFRVLNENSARDLTRIAEYTRRLRRAHPDRGA